MTDAAHDRVRVGHAARQPIQRGLLRERAVLRISYDRTIRIFGYNQGRSREVRHPLGPDSLRLRLQ